MPEQPHEACFVAVADEEVVGGANLGLLPRGRLGHHCMTGVARLAPHRVVGALEARDDGLDRDGRARRDGRTTGNAPMRAVYARLGYHERRIACCCGGAAAA